MLRLPNVATPATAAIVVVPARVAPPGFEPSATLTFPVKLVAVLPSASCATTRTAGVITDPAVALVGCTVNASWLAAPAATSNAALVAPLTRVALAASVQPPPALLTLRFENVAIPLTATTVVVPTRVPPAGLAPIGSATLPLHPVGVFAW